MPWQRTLIHTGFLLLLASGIGYLHYLLRGSERARRIGLLFFILGTASSASAVVLRYVEYLTLYPGSMVIGPCETLLLLSFFVSFFTLIALFTTRIRMLPLAAAPVAGILTVSAAFTLGIRAAPRENLVGSLAAVHVLSGILSYSAFFLLLALSSIYLVVEGELRRRPLRPILERVPSLKDLSEAQTLFLGMGFVFLTMLILLGAIQAWRVQQPGAFPDPKVLFSAVMWLVYGILLGLRLKGRLLGHRMAVAAVWASLLIVITFVSDLTWHGWHNFLQGPQREEPLKDRNVSNSGGEKRF